ncbi:hypothetical protein AB434_0652 [Heyndrickxia coagulans]|nr:hypothetical protein AB434_0652 [Heyndrickxia coagulans]KYC62379.1 hypothetical protein B4100_1850 [Heyndrickxia coagulans]KYC78558.1 hypothetical protein B4096_1790 [Heyndrickxia coagulans]
MAQNPIIRQPATEDRMVANTLKLTGIPASAKIIGLTMMIYEMAKKPVIPAVISLFIIDLSEKACHKDGRPEDSVRS